MLLLLALTLRKCLRFLHSEIVRGCQLFMFLDIIIFGGYLPYKFIHLSACSDILDAVRWTNHTHTVFCYLYWEFWINAVTIFCSAVERSLFSSRSAAAASHLLITTLISISLCAKLWCVRDNNLLFAALISLWIFWANGVRDVILKLPFTHFPPLSPPSSDWTIAGY